MRRLIIAFLILTMPTICYANEEPDPYYRVIYNEVLSNTNNSGYSHWVTQTILVFCSDYQVDPLLATALFKHESNFNPYATSEVGAYGVSQLMPDTAIMVGVNILDPGENIQGGIIYLGNQLKRFSYMGDWAATYAIAAYNAGPGSIYNNGGNLPPYRETYNHISKICDTYIRLQNNL